MGAIPFLLAAAYFACFVGYGYHLGEDGDVVSLIGRTFSGARPYIDFASGYAPGFYYANAALFWAFGPDVRVLRWSMVAVNAFAVLGLYQITARVLPPLGAVLPALAYAALMPLYPGEFATFNIPYPAWHVVLCWALSLLAFLRGHERQRLPWTLAAGALAGVGCAFKPNVGAFNLAALGLLLLAQSGWRGRGLLQATVWWGLWLGVLGALAAVFGFELADRDARLLLWPVFALAGVIAFSGARLSPAPFLGQALCLLGGFAAVTLPWTAHYAAALGWDRFLHDVLFIGSGHALFFYLPIPALGLVDALLALVAMAALSGLAAPLLRRRGALLFAAAAVALAAVAVSQAPMPEGFRRAAMQRFESLAYAAALVAHWLGVALVTLALRRPQQAGGEAARAAELAIAISAPLLFLGVYPRSDFFHWVLSAPFTLALGTLLYWRAAEASLAGVAPPAWAALPLYAALLFAWWPGLALAARLALSPPGAFAALGLARAPVVLESGRADRLRRLRQTVEIINRRTGPGDTLLGFPNLQLLNLLSGRQVPGRFGSFHAGWPDHVIESQIVDDLEHHRTPLVVINQNPELYLGNAPVYYFLLRDYLAENYRLAAEVDGFQILEREPGAGAPEPAPAEPAKETAPAPPSCAAGIEVIESTRSEDAGLLGPCWKAAEPRQERAVALARETRDPLGAAALARALRDGVLEPRAALPAVRLVGESGDARSFPAATAALERLDGRARDELITALLHIAVRSFLASQHLYPRQEGLDEVRADPRLAELMPVWLASPDPRLRYAGAWLAGLRRDPAAVADLRRMLRQPPVEFQAQAAASLLEIGVRDGIAEPLLEGMGRDEMYLPTLLLAWSRADPEAARALLADRFRHGNPLQRESIAFVAGALGDPALIEVVAAGVDDPEPRVRSAAAWARRQIKPQTRRNGGDDD